MRLIKSSGLARMAHRTTNARRSGLFLGPENEPVILGRGTSDRANTRGRRMASPAAAERHSMASSGRLRPATHRPAWRRRGTSQLKRVLGEDPQVHALERESRFLADPGIHPLLRR